MFFWNRLHLARALGKHFDCPRSAPDLNKLSRDATAGGFGFRHSTHARRNRVRFPGKSGTVKDSHIGVPLSDLSFAQN
jgi:hypothetical protein